MVKGFVKNSCESNGMSYNEFIKLTTRKLEITDTSTLGDEDKSLFEYTKLNLKRMERADKTYNVGDELTGIIKNITIPQTWMIITEAWCGDSAQTLPYIVKMASLNPMIYLRIVLRDKNLDTMDEYLTAGTRSVPILVSFDLDGNELFKWGPRPLEAVELVKRAKSEGKTKDQFIEELHLWYGRNRGKALESEFITLLR